MICFFVADLHGRPARYRRLLRAARAERPAAIFLGGDLLPHMAAARSSDGGHFVEAVLQPTFASLAATMMNAAEVLYTGLGRTPPGRVVAEADGCTLVATALGSKAMLVALGANREEVLRGVEEMTAEIRDAMAAKV